MAADDADGTDEICVRRFKKSNVLVVAMRVMVFDLKVIWLTKGELARYKYAALLEAFRTAGP